MIKANHSGSISTQISQKNTDFSQQLLHQETTNLAQNVEQTQILQKFLQFQLSSSDWALLEAKVVTEIITVTQGEILPVPQMNHCVMGVYAWRSEMLWIVDLADLLGYTSLVSTKTIDPSQLNSFIVMVAQFEGQSLGLVVARVHNIIQQDLQELCPPSPELFNHQTIPFLQGYFNDSQERNSLLLKPEIVFQSLLYSSLN